MKKIISGTRYDTDKATLVFEASAGLPRSDFSWWQEAIYRTQKGRWFLVGSGGPMSRYAVTTGNETSGQSDQLRPISPDLAQEWLERYGTPELVETFFRDKIADA